jgi:hypothetical protein
MAITVAAAEPPAGEGALVAAFDTVRKAPNCGAVGWSCDTGASLVMSRGLGGKEPNAPNTLGASCLDGETGLKAQRWNATDQVRVATLDGSPFAPGATVRIDATVWAAEAAITGVMDSVDLFYTTNADNPKWGLLGTAVLPAAGPQRVSAFLTLRAGAVQAVRVQLRQQGSAVPCHAGTTSDRDDLVFAVGATP